MSSKNKFGRSFGIMQGRLLEQTSAGYQAFPIQNWVDEFEIAEILCFDHIEWIFDSNSSLANPIFNAVYLENFLNQQRVKVVSVCGDFFMDNQIHSRSLDNLGVLKMLVESMNFLHVDFLILPFVDQSSARNIYGIDHLIDTLNTIDASLGGLRVMIALETDLNPAEFNYLLGNVNGERYFVNYDIGNSASLGYNFQEELDAYSDLIRVLHIKDRLLSGPSVKLGQGVAQLAKILESLANKESNIITTLQCYRDTEGLKVLEEQLLYLHDILQNL
jgi:L-ribulose-5-phosphate 3-epimerase